MRTNTIQQASPAEPRRDVSALEFRVEPFAKHHLPLVAAFSERYWSRPREQAFYRWRYLDPLPFSRLFLALNDNECFGMVFGLQKSYLIAGTPTDCIEIFDWHSLPGLRGSGVGLRVMRAMMRGGLRLVGMGGTADVRKTLPAMGWQTFEGAADFELPVSGGALEAGLRDRLGFLFPGARLLLDAVTMARFRPRRRAYDGRVVPAGAFDDDVRTLYAGHTGYDFVQVPDPEQLRWMTAGHAVAGTFRYWYFLAQERLRGWALTRVYETERGREASILEVFAPNADARLYAWMVSETATALAGERPQLIRARATCPVLKAALRMNRFRQAASVPVYTWPKTLAPDLRLHITLNHTDAWMRPYWAPEPIANG
jgi:hypothetical protein